MDSDAAIKAFLAVENAVAVQIGKDSSYISRLLSYVTDEEMSAASRRTARQQLYTYVGEFAEPLIVKYGEMLGDLGGEAYRAARKASVGSDDYTPVVYDLGQLDTGRLTGALIKGGPSLLGQAMTYSMRDGYNQTIMANSRHDPRGVGWARQAEPGACWFCLMLSSRGFVYYTQATASFAPHNSCRCSAVAVFDTAKLTSVAKFQGNITAKFTPTVRTTGRGAQPDAETQRRYAAKANAWATSNGLTDRAIA